MRLLRLSLVSLLSLTSACTSAIDSPQPTVSSVSPNLVCNQQLTTPVRLTGSNFTPLPEKTLEGPEVIELPQVSLTRATDLAGAASTSEPVVINPHPADPGFTRVRWQSDAQLTFDVAPDEMLAVGVYDVAVTNPDKHGATLAHSLAVVPPPSIKEVIPPNICDAQGDQMFTVVGEAFLVIGDQLPRVEVRNGGTAALKLTPSPTGCMPAAAQVMPGVQLCTSLAVTVPRDSLAPGTYTLVVTNPAPANCASTEAVNFVVEPPPRIDSVLPTHLCAGGGPLDVKGAAFLPGAKVTLSDPATSLSVDAGMVTVSADGTDAAASFGGGFTPGDKLDVTLANADGCSATLPQAVTVVPGPIVFYVDPPFVYGAITTPVTVYTTGVIAPLPSTGAVVLTPTGATTPQIDLTAASKVDPQHPKHIVVDVPPTVAAGTYDLTVADASGCAAFYPKAITVVSQKTTLKDMRPPFGYDVANTDVIIDAALPFFQAGARAYLAPHGGGSLVATPLSTVTAAELTGTPPLSARLTAVVSASPTRKLADGLYDLITVNPDGTIGFLDSAFTAEPTAPPVITSISPAGVAANCAGTACDVTIVGQRFAAAAGSTPAPVALDCVLPGTQTHMTYTPTFDSATATQVKITIAAGSIPQGNVCVPTVNDSVGNTMFATGGTIAILQPSFNINQVLPGSPLESARRAPAVTVNGPTLAARFVYAIGGDSGVLAGGLPTAPLNTVEIAQTDPASGEGAWKILPAQANLPAAGVTLAGAVNVGRFIYLLGGHDGTASLATVLRSEVLDPAEAPQVTDADLATDATDGLSPGLYFYRVAAVLDASDSANPGGESLASDEFAIRVPAFVGRKIQVTISWQSGLANVHHWRVYRTSAPDALPLSEDVVFVTASAASTTFIDKGATLTAFVAGSPLPLGALGVWAQQKSLNRHRAGAGVAVITDQTPGVNRAYLYSGFGFDSTASGAAQLPASYEQIAVDTTTGLPASGSWSEANVNDGVTQAAGRWLGGAWAVSSDVDSAACPSAGGCQLYVFFGTGAASTAAAAASTNTLQPVEVGLVSQGVAGGALTFGPSVTGVKYYGYGAVTATNYLFAIGGSDAGGATSKLDADQIMPAATAVTTPTLNSSWGPQGTGQLNLGGANTARFLPGATFGPPFFYTVGGAATVGGVAVTDTFVNVF